MKTSIVYVLIFLIASCKADYISTIKDVSGDYTQGSDGWQLRLYQDSTFYFQDIVYFETYPSWYGKWTITTTHPLTIKLNLDTSDIVSRCCSQSAYLISKKWTIEIINEAFVKIIMNNDKDGPTLKRGVIHCFGSDDSHIFALTHQSK
jgi:hypothetical protein